MRMTTHWALAVLTLGVGLAACGADPGKPEADSGGLGVGQALDEDGDGYGEDVDCDDADPRTWPGAEEQCDGADNDCDGEVDEGLLLTWYPDADGDGFGDEAGATLGCAPAEGEVAQGGDCDDADVEVAPGAPERCDGVDNDCDGVVDDDVLSVWYVDADGDGYGDPAAVVESCDPEVGVVAEAGDCDDASGDSYPGADERCDEADNDCDGTVDEGVTTTFYADLDDDGYGTLAAPLEACRVPEGYSASSEDCDDAVAEVSPAGTERCNGVDDDCDGDLDEDSAVDAPLWFVDSDTDGFGDPARGAPACAAPLGSVADDTDCDDASTLVNPGATELCNTIDDDCDALVDDDDPSRDPSSGAMFYRDADTDGFGDLGAGALSCVVPVGFLSDASDCDDANNRVFPGAVEVCNDLDDNCDARVDDADPLVDLSTGGVFFADVDGDTYGAALVRACDQPAGTVLDSRDCDDADAAVNPAATEVCNGVDDDCDTQSDDADLSLALASATWFYTDADSDSYGDLSAGQQRCVQPVGTVRDSSDCDDGDAAVNPAATEVCNGVDDDCDRAADDADLGLDLSSAGRWYTDADGDRYGAAAGLVRRCLQPAGTVADASDCDDTVAATNPGATERCNSIDDDCDLLIDDLDSSLDLASASLWYPDADADTYGDPGAGARACNAPVGHIARSGDCDDARAAVSPAATERCNSLDDDCDGTVDEASAVDARTYYRDADGDTYGVSTTTTTACSAPSGYASRSADCDDARATVYPTAAELCDGLDNDCDGNTDDGVLGRSSSCPAESCEAIATDDPAATSGTYSLRPESTTFSAYCEMSADGGGWTLLFTCDANNAAYGSGWNGWWGTSLAGTVDDLSDRGKGLAFDQLDFSEVRITATVPSASTLIFSTGVVFDDMHAMIGTEPSSCSGLSGGTGRRRYTASTRTGGFWYSSQVDVVICDSDGSSSLETTSDSNHDLAIFSTNISHSNYANVDGTLGTEFVCAGGRSSYGTAANTVRLWAR
ncbi:MAG: hypothetical protein JNM72_09990 [Deltaproteobacteria bacterium]|nr:hypothetical protein [Deltaproteobacteria bacterium]